jgi:hypothetical protein
MFDRATAGCHSSANTELGQYPPLKRDVGN